MTFSPNYSDSEPARHEIEAREGPLVVEFGTGWCGYCRAAQALIAQAFSEHPDVAHLKVEDGKGRRLGRSFSVKLWPTLIFLKNGKEIARAVRPDSADEINQKLAQISSTN